MSDAAVAERDRKTEAEYWDPEDTSFWDSVGKRVANRKPVFMILERVLIALTALFLGSTLL